MPLLVGVTRRAARRRPLVNHDAATSDLFRFFVALCTGNHLVGTFQGEGGAGFVVKSGRFPGGFVVARGALCRHFVLDELSSMNVLVTAAANS